MFLSRTMIWRVACFIFVTTTHLFTSVTAKAKHLDNDDPSSTTVAQADHKGLGESNDYDNQFDPKNEVNDEMLPPNNVDHTGDDDNQPCDDDDDDDQTEECEADFLYEEEDEMDKSSPADDDYDYLNVHVEKWKEQCTIYMAPTSLKGIQALGVYTTEAVESGSDLLTSFDGPSIVVIDPRSGEDEDDEEEGDDEDEEEGDDEEDDEEEEDSLLYKQRQNWFAVWGNYWWTRGVPDHVLFESYETIDYQIMFGSLPNHHCILNALKHYYGPSSYDDTIVEDGDPGMGAFSYHNGRYFYVTEDLQAGSEIFLNYGHCNRNGYYPSWASNMPMDVDFYEAERATEKIWKAVMRSRPPLEDDPSLSSPSQQLSSSSSSSSQDIIDQFKATTTGNNKIARDLIPSNPQELMKIMMKLPREGYSNEIRARLARTMGTVVRTPNWIRENGYCLENLIPGRSTIPHAGRGAFLQFPVKKDEVIVPSPTLQIVNRTLLDLKKDFGGVTQQLLINYCFGHSETSLLLCPYTNAILLNHCSSRKPKNCGDGPNAKVQLQSGWDMSTSSWLDMTVEEMTEREDRGISFEIVALDNIARGEEVTIDYGVEWEMAWETHLSQWRAPDRQEEDEDGFSFESATLANRYKEATLQRLASNDLRTTNAHHPNLICGCFYKRSRVDDSPSYWQLDELDDWTEMTDEWLLDHFADDGGRYIKDYEEHRQGDHWPCSPIWQDGNATFVVRMWPAPSSLGPPLWAANELPRYLTNYPQESIHLFHKRYKSDQHLANAFRHHIGIPDDLIPAQWKNLRM